MILCDACRLLFAHWQPTLSVGYEYREKRTARSFNDSAYGCQLCAVVWKTLYKRSDHTPETWDDVLDLVLYIYSPDAFSISFEKEGSGGTWVIRDKYYQVPPAGIKTFLAEHFPDDDPQKYLVDVVCRLVFRQQPGQLELGHGRFTQQSTGDDDETELLQLKSSNKPLDSFKNFLPQLCEWLDTCTKHHEPCRLGHGSGFIPTRLVRVDPTSSPHASLCLRSQIPDGSRYISLSYRWADQSVYLTKSNLHEWLETLPEERLPLTLREALTACRLLGFEYIWIDALCIIQDDHDDWLQEADQMSSIYTGSYLNLSASAAASAHGGLFRRLNHLLTNTSLLTHEMSNGAVFMEDDQVGKFKGKERDEWEVRKIQQFFCDDFDKSHLHRRGWVFQEFYLSPRTFHFLDTTYWWQCKTCTTFASIPGKHMFSATAHNNFVAPEMTFVPESLMSAMKPKAKLEPIKQVRSTVKVRHILLFPVWMTLLWFLSFGRLWLFATLSALFVPGYYKAAMDEVRLNRPERKLLDEWIKLMSLYSRTLLTHETDRQAAVAGLARRFAKSFDDAGCSSTYHAGLWSHDFLLELLWTTWSASWRFRGKEGCPSWSYLYSQSETGKESISSLTIKHIEAKYKTTYKLHAQISKIDTPPLDPSNPFSSVRFGRVRLHAHAFEAPIGFNSWGYEGKGEPSLNSSVDVAYAMVRPDSRVTIQNLDATGNARSMNGEDSDEPFVFVILARGSAWPEEERLYRGLILVPAPPDYAMMPDDRAAVGKDGRYWIRVGTWGELTSRRGVEEDRRKTRKLIEDLLKRKRDKQIFEIV